MPITVANSVCVASLPTFLKRVYHQEWSERRLSGQRVGFHDKPVLRRSTVLFGAPNSPRRHGIGGCVRKRRLKAVGKHEKMSIFNLQARAGEAGMLVIEKEPDDGETDINQSDSPASVSSGRRRVQVVGDEGLAELEKHFGLLKERGKRSRNKRKKKIRDTNSNVNPVEGSNREVRERKTHAAEVLKSESGVTLDVKEVQLRSEGDAANLAQLEVPTGNGASDEAQTGLRDSQVSGNSLDWISLEEGLASLDEEEENVSSSSSASNDIKVHEGLVRVGEQWPTSLAELPGGGRLVADFVTAWDGLAGRLAPQSTSSKSTQLLLAALKLAVSSMQRASEDGRLMLSRSLAVAYTLADLQMDGGVMAAGLLHNVVEAGLVGIHVVEQQLGSSISRLLHDCLRFKRTLDGMDILDDESARAVRQFCLSYHDIHAIIIELAARLNMMRHVEDFPRYRQQILALETMQIHAPLAHAIGTGDMSLDLEDLAFKVIFPDSYESLDNWLRSHWPDGNSVLEECKLRLSEALEQDTKLRCLIDGFTISGRYKSRCSTMKKLLKDGRKPGEVYDVLGLRIVVSPKPSIDSSEARQRGHEVCYRVLEVALSIWKEVPGRLKDYIAKPKSNGYESLHVTVYLDNYESTRQSMELQIRTASMDSMADGGGASHSLYKGGLTDPEQVQQLKKLMMAAAERAALSLKELTGESMLFNGQADKDQVFMLFDKNSDGEISMAEFREVMSELGADQNDAHELMQLVDINTDGSVSADEFAEFQKQVRILRGFEGVDKEFSSQLGQELKDNSADSSTSEDGPYVSGPESRHKGVASQNDNLVKTSNEVASFELKPPVKSASITHVPSQRVSLIKTSTNAVQTSEQRSSPEIKALESGEEQLHLGPCRFESSAFERIDERHQRESSTLESRDTIESGETRQVTSSSDSALAWNEVEAIRKERIENSSKGSTSSGSPHARNLKILTVGNKPMSLSRPVYSPKNQDVSGDDVAGKAELKNSSRPSPGGDSFDAWDGLESGEFRIRMQEEDRRHINLKEGLTTLRRLVDSNNTTAARNIAKQLYEEHSGDAKLLVEYGHLERQCGDLVAAGALYSRAVKAFEEHKNLGYDYIRVLQAWGSVEVQARNAKKARHLFMESLHAAHQEELRSPGSMNGAGVYALHAWARLEEQLGNWSKARDLLARAAETQPGNAVVHQSRALLEARAHNYGAARHHFRLAVDAAPNDVICWHSWAIFEASQGKRQKMRRYFQRALELDPMDTYSFQAWAHQETLIGTKESEARARKLYEQCLKIDPKNMYSWQAWAVMEQASGNYDMARKLFELGLRVNPSSVPCLQAFAHMERTCGNLEAAQKILQKALKFEPENAAVLMEAAFVEESLGNTIMAEELFKQAGIADKQKSRVRRRMFESRKAFLLGKTREWVAVSKDKVKDGMNNMNARSSVKARKAPSHLKWQGKVQRQFLESTSVLGG